MAASKKAKVPVLAEVDKFNAILHEVKFLDDIAEHRFFIRTIRSLSWPKYWLEDLLSNEVKRPKFAEFLSDPKAKISGLYKASIENQILSEPQPLIHGEGEFGGLSEAAIWVLIQRYQKEWKNVRVFLLVRLSIRAAEAKIPVPFALHQAVLDLWNEMLADTSGQLFRDFQKAVEFARDPRPPGDIWQVHVLFHILSSPAPRYKVGELHKSLPLKFQGSNRKDNSKVEKSAIRAFCAEHGIRRDEKAGRPSGKKEC